MTSRRSPVPSPTVKQNTSRIQVLDRIRSVPNTTLFKQHYERLWTTVCETEIKDFDSEAIDVLPVRRSKQPRTFPKHYVGLTPCFMHWPDADGVDTHHDALARLCAKVTRIGHSSSLVWMWLAEPWDAAEYPQLEQWQCDDSEATVHCRRIASGLLDTLPAQTRIPRVEAFAESVWQIEDAQRDVQDAKARGDSEAKKTANRALKEAKQAFEDEFGQPYKNKKSLVSPPRLRPKIGLWSGYRRADMMGVEPDVQYSHFDTDLLLLTQMDGPQLPVVSALAVSQALRAAVMKHGPQPTPTWVSGHKTDGGASKDEAGHLAVLPLPFVGREHADGHLLGMAIAFPRSVGRRERGRVLGPMLIDDKTGEPKDVILTLGRLGVWILRKRDWFERRAALTPETWTAHPEGALTWATVTPVVLDKYPKADRNDPKQREVWEEEVRTIIADSCTRIGLPTPIHIDVDTTSWHIGSPRSVVKRRNLRGRHTPSDQNSVALGDGFPRYPAKGANAPKPQIHVFLKFAEPVLGPMLVGAGRYRGYGLFKPWETPR